MKKELQRLALRIGLDDVEGRSSVQAVELKFSKQRRRVNCFFEIVFEHFQLSIAICSFAPLSGLQRCPCRELLVVPRFSAGYWPLPER